MEQNKTLPICDWLEAYEDGEIPEGFGFRVVGTKKIYREIGSMWKPRSDKTYCLTDDLYSNKARWFEPGTPVEIVKLQESVSA